MSFPPMQLTPIMRLAVDVHPPTSIGDTPGGEVRLIPFRGGSFETIPAAGEEAVRGTVLPGGTDWQTVRTDGALEIRAHYLLETEAEERIEVISEGIRHAEPDVLARLAAGEDVPAEEYYFRTHVRLATAAPRWDHLNRLLAVATGERRQGTVLLTVHAVP